MARGREVDPFTAIVKAKIKENNLMQRQIADMLGWTDNKVSRFISGKNYHKGKNQTGVFKRSYEDALKLACAIEPSPEFIREVLENFSEEIRWFLNLTGCKSLADVLEKMEDDGKHWFDDIFE